MDFWIRIYTEYHISQGLIHDARYIDHVYEVLELDPNPRKAHRQVKAAKQKWKTALLSLQRKVNRDHGALSRLELSAEERKLQEVYADIGEAQKYARAADRKRLRFQLGQRERFLEGLRDSGRYLPTMERIFRGAGLPIELTRLPFVESSFNLKARSKVGASGIWQFMRSTGKFFLTINSSVDERNDPIRATEAAAHLLQLNFESLKSWPLAVTAYNHGRQGMMRAVRSVGSDSLEDLVDGYKSRSFGFASTNFYACLVAAIEIERNAAQYFGTVVRLAPLEYAEAELPQAISWKELAQFLKLDQHKVKELNPGLSPTLFLGRSYLPAGYRLRLPIEAGRTPEAQSRLFLAGYQEIPEIYKRKGKLPKRYDRRISSKQD